jgi:ribosome-associated translation inhibitor RaiA
VLQSKTQFHIRRWETNHHQIIQFVSADLRRWLKQPLERLQSLIPVWAAAVVLEHRRDEAPAFRAFALLAVPGPDIHAEARDHTLEAAWLKVTTALRKQTEQRKSKQIARIKSNRQQSISMARWSTGVFQR